MLGIVEDGEDVCSRNGQTNPAASTTGVMSTLPMKAARPKEADTPLQNRHDLHKAAAPLLWQ